MSLIKVRRRRKRNWIDTRKGMSVGKLMAFFLLVIVLIWYLGTF